MRGDTIRRMRAERRALKEQLRQVTDLTQLMHAADLLNDTMKVRDTVLGVHTPHSVSLGAWGEVYGGTFWPVLDGTSAVGDDIATDAWFHLRHEP